MAAKKKSSKGNGVDAAVQKARAAIEAANEALAAVGLARLTVEERQVSSGRLREGEPRALATILDTVDAHPELFVSLADRDGVRIQLEDIFEAELPKRLAAVMNGYDEQPVSRWD